MTLLSVENLAVHSADAMLVEPISLSMSAGQSVTLIGETGSGKSLFAQAILGTLPRGLHPEGRMTVAQTEVPVADPDALSHLWGHRISVLPQEPWRALDPLMRARKQVSEVYAKARRCPDPVAQAEADLAALDLPDVGHLYPFQLSGGMAQRLSIAAARAGGAQIVIADEPTKGLDLSRRDDVARQMNAVTTAGGALLTITHDLQLAEALGGEIIVIRKGRVIERGNARQVLTAPAHPYTADLIAAEPRHWPKVAPLGPTPAVLQGKGLTIARGGRALLRDMDICLHAGEIVGLCGPSGAGKSSLGDTLLGITAPAKGSVTRANGHKATQFQKLWQDPPAAFAAHQTLGKGLRDLMALHNVPTAKLPPLLDQMRLDPALLDRHPDAVSGGELQRLSIARALLLEPVFLFADEPTSRLDPLTQREVMQMLAALARAKGIAVLLVSHDSDLIANLSDRQIVMGSG